MTAGDIVVTSPADVGDQAAIIAALSGASVVVADDITSFVSDGQVWFAVIKAA